MIVSVRVASQKLTFAKSLPRYPTLTSVNLHYLNVITDIFAQKFTLTDRKINVKIINFTISN